MTDQEFATMRAQAARFLAVAVGTGMTGLSSEQTKPFARLFKELDDARAEVERLRTENAALREIAQAVAAIGADATGDYSHEESAPWIHTCPACFKRIGGYTGDYGDQRGLHAESCPIRRARALLEGASCE